MFKKILKHNWKVMKALLLALIWLGVQPSQSAHANTSPIANAGVDQILTLPQNFTVLVGSVSDDGLPLGILTSTWTQFSGTGTVVFTNSLLPQTTATFSATGIYVLQLAASDTLLSTVSFVTITVNPSTAPVNQAPIVSAGINQTLTLPQNFTVLLGSTSDDGLPSALLTSTWTQISGTGTVVFTNPLLSQTTATFSSTGIYVLQLAASDGTLSSTSTVTITVNPSTAPVNQAPVVSAGINQTLTLPQNFTVLLGTATDDGLPSALLTSTWTQISGTGTVVFTNPLLSQTTATFSSTGIYVLQLTASDGVLSATSVVTITVLSSTQTVISTPFDKDNVIQPGTKTLLRGNDVNRDDAKIIFRTEESGQVTFYIYERTMGMKTWEFDAIQGNNEVRIRELQNQLNLTWGIYHITIRQNGKVLKQNIPLALVP